MAQLNENSLVIDAGGYLGNTTDKLVRQFNPNVIVFEPNPYYFNYLKNKFKDNPKIKVEDFALGKEEGKRELFINKDGTSFYKDWAKSEYSVSIPVVRLSDYIKDISEVDFLKINIEGSEYDVIGDLAENNQIGKIKELLVQFHKIEEWEDKYKVSQEILLKTHKKISGNFRWETWKKI